MHTFIKYYYINHIKTNGIDRHTARIERCVASNTSVVKPEVKRTLARSKSEF